MLDGTGFDFAAPEEARAEAIEAAAAAWRAGDGSVGTGVDVATPVAARGECVDGGVDSAPYVDDELDNSSFDAPPHGANKKDAAEAAAAAALIDDGVLVGTGFDVAAPEEAREEVVAATAAALIDDDVLVGTGVDVVVHTVATNEGDAVAAPAHGAAAVPRHGPVLVHIHPGTGARPAVLLAGAATAPVEPMEDAAEATAEIVCGVDDAAQFEDLDDRSSDAAVNAANAAVEKYVMAHVAGPLVLYGTASADSLKPLLKCVGPGIRRLDTHREGSSTLHTTTLARRIVHEQATHVMCDFAVSKLREALVRPSCPFGDHDLRRAMDTVCTAAVDEMCARGVATSKLLHDIGILLRRAVRIYSLSGWCVDPDVNGDSDAGERWMARLKAHGIAAEDCKYYAAQVLKQYADVLTTLILGKPQAAGRPHALVAAVKKRACESDAYAREHTNEPQVRERLGPEERSILDATITDWTHKKGEVDVETLRLLLDGLFSPAGGNLAWLFVPHVCFLTTGTA